MKRALFTLWCGSLTGLLIVCLLIWNAKRTRLIPSPPTSGNVLLPSADTVTNQKFPETAKWRADGTPCRDGDLILTDSVANRDYCTPSASSTATPMTGTGVMTSSGTATWSNLASNLTLTLPAEVLLDAPSANGECPAGFIPICGRDRLCMKPLPSHTKTLSHDGAQPANCRGRYALFADDIKAGWVCVEPSPTKVMIQGGPQGSTPLKDLEEADRMYGNITGQGSKPLEPAPSAGATGVATVPRTSR